MRTKDRPLLLRRALADVCAQTHGDWHLVVVNDGGDPGPVDAAVAHEAGLAGRVTVLHNEVSRGMEAASNQGLAAGDSTYVAIHDDDDTWHPEFLARTVAHLESTGDVAVAVRTEIVWEAVEGDRVVERGREIWVPDVSAFTLFEMLRFNRTVPISVLHRRSVHDEIGTFREDLRVVGDWEFYLRLAATEHRLGYLDGEPLAFWHQRREESDGALANSVVAADEEHRRLDLMLRDEALRAHAREHGLGPLLYVTSYFQREIDRLHDRATALDGRHDGQHAQGEQVLEALRRTESALARQEELLTALTDRVAALERSVDDASLVSLARRRYRRVKDRLLRR